MAAGSPLLDADFRVAAQRPKMAFLACINHPRARQFHAVRREDCSVNVVRDQDVLLWSSGMSAFFFPQLRED